MKSDHVSGHLTKSRRTSKLFTSLDLFPMSSLGEYGRVLQPIINHFQRTKLIPSTDKRYSLDSEDGICSGCGNVMSHQLQFVSGLPSAHLQQTDLLD